MTSGCFEKMGKPSTPADETISRDRQVIDLHWIYMHEGLGSSLSAHELFIAPDFRFDLASEFACQPIKAQDKVHHLKLKLCCQAILSFYQNDEIRRTAHMLRSNEARNRAKIQHAKAKPSSRRTDDDDYLLAVYAAVLLSAGQLKNAGLILSRMGHKSPSSASMSRLHTWLRDKAKLAF